MSDLPLITSDLSCFECGYNLRTLSRDSVCPECGTSIEASARKDVFSFLAAKSIHRIRQGIMLLFAAAGASAVANYFGLRHDGWISALLSIGPAGPHLWNVWIASSEMRMTTWAPVFTFAIWAIGQVAYFWGLLRIGCPGAADQQQQLDRRRRRFDGLRRSLLVFAIVSLVILAVSLIACVVSRAYVSRRPYLFVAILFAIDAVAAGLLHDLLGYLVRRLPLGPLALQLKKSKFAAIAGSLAMSGFMFYRWSALDFSSGPLILLGAVVLSTGGSAWSLVTLARVGQALKKCQATRVLPSIETSAAGSDEITGAGPVANP